MEQTDSAPQLFILVVRDYLPRFYNLPPELPARSQDEVEEILANGYDLTRGTEAMKWVIQHRPDFPHVPAYRRFIIKWPMILEVKQEMRESDWDSALIRLDTLATIDDHDPSTFYHFGLVYRYTYRFSDSEQYLRRCLDLFPDLAIGHRALGFTLAYLDRKEEAIAELQTALKDLPDDDEIARALKEIKAQTGTEPDKEN
jgi:tetratricopeptide (TPR) repeat protein